MAHPRYELKRIGLFSAVKTMFVLGGFGGFVLGFLQWAIFGFMFWAMQNAPVNTLAPYGMETELLSGTLGGMAGIFFPIVGGMMGAIAGVLGAFLLGGIYNIAARIWGGLTFEASEIVPVAPQVIVPVPATPAGSATPLPSTQPPPAPAPEPPPAQEPPANDDDDDNEPPRRPSSSMYE